MLTGASDEKKEVVSHETQTARARSWFSPVSYRLPLVAVDFTLADDCFFAGLLEVSLSSPCRVKQDSKARGSGVSRTHWENST